MVFLLALAALVGSYLANKWMLKVFRENTVIFGAPIVEELLKTLPAYFLNRPIWYVHFLFGLGEALYDFFTGRRETGSGAAAAGLISHTLFGLLTDWIRKGTGWILPALAGAVFTHCAWNFIVMRAGRRN
ncbi:hypothetical protein QBE55_05680 [Eubacteriales bacterium mix99]